MVFGRDMMSRSNETILFPFRGVRVSPRPRFVSVLSWSVPLAVIVLTSGCTTTTHNQMVAFLRSNEAAVSTGHYTVNPPDALAIHAPGAAEVDGVIQRVRPDGKLSLRLLGEVEVAGLTTQEIAEKLKMQLSHYYIEPEVVVEVVGYRSQQYYVFGEVGNPGPKEYTGRDTLLKALANSRPTFLAWRSQIRVVRPEPETGESKIIVVDLDKMVRDGETGQNILLQPGDIIEVPPTPLAWIGLRVRELLYPVSPILKAYSSPIDAMDTYDDYDRHDGGNSSSNGFRLGR